MSCVDDTNLNVHEVHHELVTVVVSDSLLQLQELHESSSLHDPLLGVSSHELATSEGAEMNVLSEDTIILLRLAQALWSVQYHKLWVG